MVFSTVDGSLILQGRQDDGDRYHWQYANADMHGSQDLTVGIDGVQGLMFCHEASPREGWAWFFLTDDTGLIKIDDNDDFAMFIIAGRVEVWY